MPLVQTLWQSLAEMLRGRQGKNIEGTGELLPVWVMNKTAEASTHAEGIIEH